MLINIRTPKTPLLLILIFPCIKSVYSLPFFLLNLRSKSFQIQILVLKIAWVVRIVYNLTIFCFIGIQIWTLIFLRRPNFLNRILIKTHQSFIIILQIFYIILITLNKTSIIFNFTILLNWRIILYFLRSV